MALETRPPAVLRFGTFEVDVCAGEVRKQGVRIKLQEQPFRILTLLLQRPGEVVTREELRSSTWTADTFVDFDNSLNTSINKLREALGDSADSPRFIETLPRRGYRFIAPVTGEDGTTRGAAAGVSAPWRPSSRKIAVTAAIAVLAVGIVGGLLWRARRASHLTEKDTIVLGDFANSTARPGQLRELTPQRLTANPPENPVSAAAISPDGKYLAYADQSRIRLRLIKTGETHTLSQPEGSVVQLAWFPDGTKMLVTTSQGGRSPSVWAASILGGNPRKLRDGAAEASVSPEGSLISFITGGGPYGDVEIWLMGANGEEPHKVLAAMGGNWFGRLAWSPDGQRIAYMRFHIAPERLDKSDKLEKSIESLDLKGGPATLILSDPKLRDFCWLPDGRIVYSLVRSLSFDADSNLWEIKADTRTGQPSGKPSQITNWVGFSFGGFSVGAQGTRLAFLKADSQLDAYVGEFEPKATRLKTPRRLTLDERNDLPADWTQDSKAVLFISDRNGNFGIFKQFVDQDSAEPIVAGPEDEVGPRLSADGSWILYIARPKLQDGSSTPMRPMRVPVSGGPPQLVLTAPGYDGHRCARFPATLCILGEWSLDKKLVFTAFDPVQGRGRELTRIQIEPPYSDYNCSLSPDGSRIALTTFDVHAGRIHVLALNSGEAHDLNIKGWVGLNSMDWSADGKGLFVSSQSPGGATLLYVDLEGRAHALWQPKGITHTWGVPSPDGRYLAILGGTTESNAWMMENF